MGHLRFLYQYYIRPHVINNNNNNVVEILHPQDKVTTQLYMLMLMTRLCSWWDTAAHLIGSGSWGRRTDLKGLFSFFWRWGCGGQIDEMSGMKGKMQGAWKKKKKKFANGILCDIIHWVYQGDLFFQNVIWFCGTWVSVVSSWPTWKVWPAQHWFVWTRKYSTAFCAECSILTKWDNKSMGIHLCP